MIAVMCTHQSRYWAIELLSYWAMELCLASVSIEALTPSSRFILHQLRETVVPTAGAVIMISWLGRSTANQEVPVVLKHCHRLFCWAEEVYFVPGANKNALSLPSPHHHRSLHLANFFLYCDTYSVAFYVNFFTLNDGKKWNIFMSH